MNVKKLINRERERVGALLQVLEWAKERVWDRLEDRFEFLSRWRYWYSMTDWLHPTRTIRKVRNVVRWVPILWRDVDWDYSSLYTIIREKIRFMRVHHVEHHNHEDWEEVVAQMRVTEKCLARLVSDNYLMDEHVAHWEKFPRKPTSEWEKTPEGHSIMPPMSEPERESFTDLVKREDELREADMKEFARQLAENSRKWWD